MAALHSPHALRPSGTCRAASRPRPRRAAATSTLLLGLVLSSLYGCGGSPRPAATSSAGSAEQGTPLARGQALYFADGCDGCHSLDGSRESGPSWKGLAGSRVRLSDGSTVVADDAYLTRHIVEPGALTVQGYPGGVMAESIQGLDLARKPADVAALVAFIDSVGR